MKREYGHRCKNEPMALTAKDFAGAEGLKIKCVHPDCKDGVVFVARDQHTLDLLSHAWCVACGQRFVIEGGLFRGVQLEMLLRNAGDDT